MRYYAGIGSRRTPNNILLRMQAIASDLATASFILRSGGADGADSAFERGCDDMEASREIFLPWKGFNKNQSRLFEIPDGAYKVAQKFHPAWFALSPAAKKLMARNSQQVLGKNLDSPSEFVICWTPDGCESNDTRTKDTGGTGQAISIADNIGIPVINLKNGNAEDRIKDIFIDIELMKPRNNDFYGN